MKEIDWDAFTLTEAQSQGVVEFNDEDGPVTFKARYDGLAYRAEHACPMPKPKAKWQHTIYVCDCGGQWLSRYYPLGGGYWVRYRGEKSNG